VTQSGDFAIVQLDEETVVLDSLDVAADCVALLEVMQSQQGSLAGGIGLCPEGHLDFAVFLVHTVTGVRCQCDIQTIYLT